MIEAYRIIKAFMKDAGATMSEGDDWSSNDAVAFFGFTDYKGVHRHEAETALNSEEAAKALVEKLAPTDESLEAIEKLLMNEGDEDEGGEEEVDDAAFVNGPLPKEPIPQEPLTSTEDEHAGELAAQEPTEVTDTASSEGTSEEDKE